MKKKLGFLSLLSVAVLVSCGGGGSPVDTGYLANDAKAYAGYSADINADGTISSNEKGLTWAQSYDVMISTIKQSSDQSLRFKLMHKAEDLLMSTGAICPLYNYTDVYMKSKKMTGFYSSPLGFKYFQNALVDGSGKFTVCLASEPQTIDPALNSAVDGASLCANAFSGIMKFASDGKGGVTLVPDVAVESFNYDTDYVVNSDGSVTYSIPLKKNLKWSDGTSYDARDFVFSWNRAAGVELAADYGYMFDVIKNYDKVSTDKTGTEKLAVEAVIDADGGYNTLKVTTNNLVPYFGELLAFPAYYPVKESVVSNSKWATEPSSYVGNGPMKLSQWNHNSAMVYVKNENYHGEVAKATELTFALSDDDTSMLTNFKNGDWAFIDSVPNDQIDTLKSSNPDEFFVAGQLGTYYINFNVKDGTFNEVADTEEKREDVRNALSLMIDRNYIVKEIGKAGQTAANGFVATGLTDPTGGEYVDHNGVNGDGKGYYSTASTDLSSNRAKAVEMLKEVGYTYDESKKVFTNIPKIKYITNNSSGHIAIAEYLQTTFASFGISASIEKSEWADFLTTRKAGNFSLARNGWLADYNDPISFLDMWITDSGNNDAHFGQ